MIEDRTVQETLTRKAHASLIHLITSVVGPGIPAEKLRHLESRVIAGEISHEQLCTILLQIEQRRRPPPGPDVAIIDLFWYLVERLPGCESPQPAKTNPPAPQTATFAGLVRDELAAARRNHAPLNSAHEAYAVILEELDEFRKEVWRRREVRVPKRMLGELVQTAAMCQRAAEDLELAAAGADNA